jgi:hypothetical protein
MSFTGNLPVRKLVTIERRLLEGDVTNFAVPFASDLSSPFIFYELKLVYDTDFLFKKKKKKKIEKEK